MIFPTEWRQIVGELFRDRLEQEGSQVLCISVSGQHIHALAKLPQDKDAARIWVGLAKRHVTFELHDREWQGLVWAKRSKETPIKDRKHHVNVFNYILAHAEEGAWVWSFRDRLKKPEAHG